jgi:hypothetical protein
MHGNISRKLPVVATFILKELKYHVFYFLFSLLQKQRTGGWNMSCPGERAGTSGKGQVLGKGCRRVITV